MARDRLAARKAGTTGSGGAGVGYPQDNYGDQNYPAQTQPAQPSYPPATTRAQNPYAQQDVPAPTAQTYTPVAGMGPNNGAGQYGQQDAYAMGGVGGNGNGAGGDFWAELSTTQASLNEMQDAIQQVRNAHAASLSRLDTTPNSAAARETDQLIASTRALTSQNKNAIQQLNKLAKDKAQKQQVAAAKSRFMGLLNDYQVVEKEFRKKVKERGERQYKIVKPDATPEEIKTVLDNPNQQVFSQALLSSNRYGESRGALKEVQERAQDLAKIEKTITELAQMFQEMSMLVEQQDETLAVIENQAAGVDKDMEQGLKHTEGAVKKARSARRKKIWCFWISVIIILIAVAIVLGIVCGANNKC